MIDNSILLFKYVGALVGTYVYNLKNPIINISGVCRRVGWVQPQLPPLLHEPLDQAEQPVSALPAGLDRPEVGKIKTTHRSRECLKNFFTIRIFCFWFLRICENKIFNKNIHGLFGKQWLTTTILIISKIRLKSELIFYSMQWSRLINIISKEIIWLIRKIRLRHGLQVLQQVEGEVQLPSLQHPLLFASLLSGTVPFMQSISHSNFAIY